MKYLLTTAIVLVSLVSFGQKHSDWQLVTKKYDLTQAFDKTQTITAPASFIKRGDSLYMKIDKGGWDKLRIVRYANDSTYTLDGGRNVYYFPKQKIVQVYYPQNFDNKFY